MILDRLFGIQSNQFYKLVCKIPVINKIKKNSIVIIGHPYGSGIARENEQSLFPEKIESFLENNKHNIKILEIHS